MDDLIAFQKAHELPSPPITVALLGVDHLTFEPGEKISGSKPYFLFVSTIEARKKPRIPVGNVERLGRRTR